MVNYGTEWGDKELPEDLVVTQDNYKEITNLIKYLLTKRADYVKAVEEDVPFVERFFVFNNDIKDVDDEVFVLRPADGQADIDTVINYTNHSQVNPMLRRNLKEWIKEYSDYRCGSKRRGVCKITGSPVCCAYCRFNGDCITVENTPICPLVEVGDVVNIEDCEEV